MRPPQRPGSTTTPGAVAELIAGTKKGSPIESAKLAGVLGVKRTPDLLPHCHPIRVTGAEVEIEPDAETGRIKTSTTVRAVDRTGVEMEALTAAAVAALSLYDTAKAFDRSARIDGIRLLAKSGGRSGDYRADLDRVTPVAHSGERTAFGARTENAVRETHRCTSGTPDVVIPCRTSLDVVSDPHDDGRRLVRWSGCCSRRSASCGSRC